MRKVTTICVSILKNRFDFLVLALFLIILDGGIANGQKLVIPARTDVFESKISLNGDWFFHESYHGNVSDIAKAGKNWGKIKVPGEWFMQGYKVEYGKPGTYFRKFYVPETWKGQIVYLRCDAVFSRARIWVNGQEAGIHDGPMVVFDTEITRHIKVGSTNRLTIQIVSETMADTLMSGSQYVAHQLGGILRKIYVVAVPKTHLTDLAVFTSPDKKYINFDLTIKGLIINRGNEELASVKIMLTDPEGSNIPLDNNKIDIVLKGIKEEEFEMTLPVICPNKWDVEHPNLYQLNIIIRTGEGFEQIQKNIGFREIKVDGNQVLINGQPVKLKGVNRHEVYPLTGRSITPELCELDAKKFKTANVNYIRTSHYPPCEEFINWCNKLGLYVELENPISWVGHPTNKYWKDHDPHTPDFYPYLEKISDDNISFFRNHPSIIIWSMGNESFWGPNWEKLARFYAHKDSTRPATFHDQAYGKFNNKGSTDMPVANFHYPGYEGLPIAENFERPLLFGEYAHMNTYNRSEIITDPGVRDAWGHEFNKMWEGMYTIKACLGGAVWSGIDDVFMLPDGSITGYGEWGIIDGWRREKPEYYHLKKIYSPVKIVNVNERIIPDKNGGITLEIENRFDFTNLNECDIFWEMGNKNGQAVLSLEPHKQRMLTIFPGVENIEGGRLKVRIISPQGYEVETVAINIGNEESQQPVFSKITSTKLKTSEKNNVLTIQGNGFSWEFDKKKGKLSGAKVSGEEILKDGVELMILGNKTNKCEPEASLHVPFFNSVCSGWKLHNFTWLVQNDSVIVTVTGSYNEANVEIQYAFSDDAKLKVSYLLKSKIQITPRQVGLVFSVPSGFDNLEWERNGLWSCYPEDHIGRNSGKAKAFGEIRLSGVSLEKPQHGWRFDANDLGCNDFRATRENIYWATLSSDKGTGILILSDGVQAFRSFVNEGNINFLVADYSSGGGDLFILKRDGLDSLELEDETEYSGSATIQLIGLITKK